MSNPNENIHFHTANSKLPNTPTLQNAQPNTGGTAHSEVSSLIQDTRISTSESWDAPYGDSPLDSGISKEYEDQLSRTIRVEEEIENVENAIASFKFGEQCLGDRDEDVQYISKSASANLEEINLMLDILGGDKNKTAGEIQRRIEVCEARLARCKQLRLRLESKTRDSNNWKAEERNV